MSAATKQAKRERRRVARRTRHRVLLERPVKPDAELSESEVTEQLLAYFNVRDREVERTIHPIVRLTADGVDWGVAPGAGDEIGFGMHPYRVDECFSTAVATATQVPIEEVPDFQLDARLDAGEDPDEISASVWRQIEEWAAGYDFSMTIWDTVPVPRDRWIAVSEGSADEEDVDDPNFEGHCLVMCRDRIHFDPSCSLVLPAGTRLRKHDTSSISYGISFEKE